MQYLVAVSKMTEWYVCFQGKPFNITVIQLYALTNNGEEAEAEQFYSRTVLELLELTPQKDVFFIIGNWNAKVRSKEIQGGKWKIWPWSTEWSRPKANRVFPREHTGHSKHSLLTTEESTHGHHQMVNTEISLFIFFEAKNGEALYSQQKQDQELTVAQIMNTLLQNSDLNWWM